MIIKTVNPYPQRGGQMAQEVRDSDRAASEFVADHFPEAHMIKAFNPIYFKNMQDQAFPEAQRRAIPYAGDHQPSLKKAEQLIKDIGFDPVYVGQLSESDIIDSEQALYSIDLAAQKRKPSRIISKKIKPMPVPHPPADHLDVPGQR